jgi:response regulator RpfG family c-di-GMP phosphodiesterase
MLTAYKDTDTAIQTLYDGASDFINKPFKKEKLLNAVARVLQEKQLDEVYNAMKEEIAENTLSIKEKAYLLKELYYRRKKNNDVVSMKDVYVFFPKLKETNIPDQFALTDQIFEDGIITFVDEIESKMKETTEFQKKMRQELAN